MTDSTMTVTGVVSHRNFRLNSLMRSDKTVFVTSEEVIALSSSKYNILNCLTLLSGYKVKGERLNENVLNADRNHKTDILNHHESLEGTQAHATAYTKQKEGKRVRLYSLDCPQSSHLELELIFSELATRGNNTLKYRDLIQSIEKYVSLIQPDLLSVSPIPHPSLLDQFENCVRGDKIDIGPHFSSMVMMMSLSSFDCVKRSSYGPTNR